MTATAYNVKIARKQRFVAYLLDIEPIPDLLGTWQEKNGDQVLREWYLNTLEEIMVNYAFQEVPMDEQLIPELHSVEIGDVHDDFISLVVRYGYRGVFEGE